MTKTKVICTLLIGFTISCTTPPMQELESNKIADEIEVSDPLPSWNEGETKNAIVNFVKDVS